MNEEFRRWWAQNHPTERAAVEISETYRAAQDGWRKTPTYHEVRDIIAKHVAAASSPAPASPAPTPEQIVYNVAQRDPFFRKHLIEQLVAMGDEQDTGPLRTLPEGEQECQRCGKTGGKVVSFNCGSLTTARSVCPYCLDAATPTTPSAAAMRAAEEISSTFSLKFQADSLHRVAAIITRRLVGTPAGDLQKRLFDECVTANWDPERKNTFAEEIAHLHEELSEAFRAWRRYKDCEIRVINGKLEGVPIEFADALIGMFYNAELYGFDLLAAVETKHQFNLTRNYVQEGRQLHAAATSTPSETTVGGELPPEAVEAIGIGYYPVPPAGDNDC